MDSWQYARLAYGVAGGFYMILEHRCFDFDFSEATRGQMILVALQQTIHYFRVALLWPSYLVEDFLIYLSNREDV